MNTSFFGGEGIAIQPTATTNITAIINYLNTPMYQALV